MQTAFDKLTDDIWTYSEELFVDAVKCNVGQQPCETGTLYDLTLVEVTEADKALIGTAVPEVSFPAWKEICDATNPACSTSWMETVGVDKGF
jgi:hypothetical protein